MKLLLKKCRLFTGTQLELVISATLNAFCGGQSEYDAGDGRKPLKLGLCGNPVSSALAVISLDRYT